MHAPISATVWECWNPTLANLVMTSTRSTRPVEDYLLTTGSKFLLVYTKCTVIMELECGGHKGGWMRIADLGGDDCPTGWRKITTPDSSTHPSKVACQSLNGNSGCFPTSFTVNGASYHKICGKVRGYQHFTPDAFAPSAGGGRSYK